MARQRQQGAHAERAPVHMPGVPIDDVEHVLEAGEAERRRRRVDDAVERLVELFVPIDEEAHRQELRQLLAGADDEKTADQHRPGRAGDLLRRLLDVAEERIELPRQALAGERGEDRQHAETERGQHQPLGLRLVPVGLVDDPQPDHAGNHRHDERGVTHSA